MHADDPVGALRRRGDLPDRNCRRVRRDDRVVINDRLGLGNHAAFELQVLEDRLDHEIGARNGGGVASQASVEGDTTTTTQTVTRQRPSFGMTMFSVLLPVALMMGKALVDIFIDDEANPVRQTFDILGRPLVALLIAVIVGIFTLGRGAAMTRDQIVKCVESSLPPVAGIILIVAAGGGYRLRAIRTGDDNVAGACGNQHHSFNLGGAGGQRAGIGDIDGS